MLEEISKLEQINKKIEQAEKLDERLPDNHKDSNSHLNDLKEEFPLYFKEESGNNTVKDSLGNLKENTKNEIDITKQVLK